MYTNTTSYTMNVYSMIHARLAYCSRVRPFFYEPVFGKQIKSVAHNSLETYSGIIVLASKNDQII